MSHADILDRRDHRLPLPRATTLVVRRAGVLKVPADAGSAVWLTVDGEAQDRVLQPGEGLSLARGHRVVVEPWRADRGAALCWRAQGASAGTAAPPWRGWTWGRRLSAFGALR